MPSADVVDRGQTRDDSVQRLSLLRTVLPRLSGDGESPHLPGRRPRLSGPPLPQLWRVPVCVPVRAATRIRHQRAADARGGSAGIVRAVLLATRHGRLVPASRSLDRRCARGWLRRGHARGRVVGTKGSVLAAERRTLLRGDSASRDGRAVWRRLDVCRDRDRRRDLAVQERPRPAFVERETPGLVGGCEGCAEPSTPPRQRGGLHER